MLIQFTPKGSYDEAIVYIDSISEATAAVQERNPDFYVGQAGSASTGKALNEMFSSQLARAGLLSIPLTLMILLLVFGSLVGASIPLLLALTSVFATMGLVALPSQIVPMDESIAEVILLIGLAVGVDYSLFYIRRERDERRAGRSESAALEAAAATSGRAVLISGVTVMIAMAGMFFSGDKMFMSFAIGTMMVVAVAMIGSLTVLPAMLSWLGDRVDKVRVPFLRRLQAGRRREPCLGRDPRPRPSAPARLCDRRNGRARRAGAARAEPAHGESGARRPAEVAEGAAVVQQGQRRLPRWRDARHRGHRRRRVRPRAEGRGRRPTQQALASGTGARADLRRGCSRWKGVSGRRSRSSARARTAPSNDALATLRDEIIPATLGTVAGVEYAVTGETGSVEDWNEAMKSAVPIVFAFVLAFAFILLLVTFRSVVIPLKAILMNLLSVGAAYGVARRDLPVGLGREPARLQLERWHRRLAADVPVRDPVRPLDGLPRVHPEPGARVLRPWPEHRARRRSTASARPPASSRAPRS